MIRNPLDNPLILRNYYQIKDADQVIAVGKMNNFGVLGGTKWATQMGIDKQIPVFMFDQTGNFSPTAKGGWHFWDYTSETWQPTKGDGVTPPTLTKNTAGVGTREINNGGRKAIRSLFKDIKPVKDVSSGIIHSGGAIGADTLFEELGVKKGFEVQAHSFDGHKTESANRVIHSGAELKAARDPVYTAKASLDFDYNLRQHHIKIDKLRVQAAGAQTNILATLTDTTGKQIASSEGALKPDWAFRDAPNIYTEEGEILSKPKKQAKGRGAGGAKSKILYQRDAVKLLKNEAFLEDLGLLRNTFRGYGGAPSLYAMDTASAKTYFKGHPKDNPLKGVGYGLNLPPVWEELLTSIRNSFEGLSEAHLASDIPKVEEGARGLLKRDEKRIVERVQRAKAQVPFNRLEKAVADINALLNPGTATVLSKGIDRAQFVENTSNMAFAGENTRDLAAEVRKVNEKERIKLGGNLQRAGTTVGAHAAKDLAEYEQFVKNRPRTGILQLMYPGEANAPRNLTGGSTGLPPFKGIDVTEKGEFIRFREEDFTRRTQTRLPSDYFEGTPGRPTPLAGGIAEEVKTTSQLMPSGEWKNLPVGGQASMRTMAELEAMRRGVTMEPQRSILPADYFSERVEAKPSKPKVPSLSGVGTAKVSGFVEEVKKAKKNPDVSGFFRPQKPSTEATLISQADRMKAEAREHNRFLRELAKRSPASEEKIAKNLMKPTQYEAWAKARDIAEANKQKKFAKAWAKIMKGGNVKMLLPTLLFAGLFGTMMSNDRNVA